MSHSKVCFFVGLVALACARSAVAGTATFAGLGDEVPLEAEGLTKVQATADGYTLTGGSTSFTDDCTGAQGDHVAIHESVISQLNQNISDGLFESRDANWEITLQLDPSSAAIDPPSGQAFAVGTQAWGVGIRFGNGTNQTTSPSGSWNFGRGADLIFGFTDIAVSGVTFPRLIPYVLVVGADFSLTNESQFFNFFHAVDFTFNQIEAGFFQDFLGTDGKLILRRIGSDEFSRPIIEIHSELEGRSDTWAWTYGNTGNPGPPVVNADFRQVTNVNLNGLIPEESAVHESGASLGMPVTSFYLFVENETTWIRVFGGSIIPEDPGSDECFGAQPTPDETETYAIDFDFPVDDPGEIDSNDAEGFQAILTGPRDDINSYGNVEEQRTLPVGAGRFGCLTIVSEAIPDINPNSSCEGPRITLNPESVTVDLVQDPSPQNAEFAVEATGTGELAYQWLKDGVPIRAVRGAHIGNINSGIGGGRNAGDGTLEVMLLDQSTVQAETWVFTAHTVVPAAFFSAVGSASGPSGTILATQGGLAFPVTDSLSVMIEQGAKPFEVGDVFRFTVAVDPVENETADEPTLVIADVTGADAGKYRALVTDEIGTASSNPAQLEVIEPIPLAARRWETYE